MMHKKGLTLIELLAAIIILGIIAAIALPTISGIIRRASTHADKANIIVLNEATRLYKLGENIYEGDIFEGIDTNSDRINRLFTYGYLESLATPMQPYVSYEWNIADQTWMLGDLLEIVLPPATSFSFDTVRLIDMISYGATVPVGNFTDSGDYFQSGGGLMYIPNPNKTYVITVNAQILSSSTYGGFGVMFDSTASNYEKESDSGWIVQVDRGYASGEIVIRPRVNGKEQSPVHRYPVRFNSEGEFSTIEGLKNSSNPWWNQAHILKLEVSMSPTDSTKKIVAVSINHIFLFDYEFSSTIDDDTAYMNLTGLRAWNGINVAFYELNIQ